MATDQDILKTLQAIQKALTSSRTSFDGGRSEGFEQTSQDDYFKDVNQEIAFYEKNLKKLSHAEKVRYKQLQRQQIIDKKTEQLRTALNDLDYERARQLKREIERIEQGGQIRDEFDKQISQLSMRFSEFSFDDFLNAMKAGMDDYTTALRLGTEIGLESYQTSLMSGISQQFFSELRHEYKTTAISMKQQGSSFGDAIQDMQLEMFELTGDLSQAARATSHFISSSRELGLSQENSKLVMKDLKDQFAVFHNNLGWSVDEFQNLTNSIIRDTESRKLMLRMNEDERRQYVNSRVELTKFYTSMGVGAEAAMEMQSRFDDMFSKKSAKDRIKDAVKISVLGGMAGSSPEETNRMRSLIMKGYKRTEQETRELQRFANNTSTILEQQMGMGIGAELGIQALDQSLGGILTDLRDINTSMYETQKIDADESNVKRNEHLKDILGVVKGIGGGLDSFPALLIGAMVPMGLYLGKSLIKPITTGLMRIGGTLLTGVMRLLPMGLAAWAGWKIGTYIGDKILDGFKAIGWYDAWVDIVGESVTTIKSWGTNIVNWWDGLMSDLWNGIVGLKNSLINSEVFKFFSDPIGYVASTNTVIEGTGAAVEMYKGTVAATSYAIENIANLFDWGDNNNTDTYKETVVKETTEREKEIQAQRKNEFDKQLQIMTEQSDILKIIAASNMEINDKTKKRKFVDGPVLPI